MFVGKERKEVLDLPGSIFAGPGVKNVVLFFDKVSATTTSLD